MKIGHISDIHIFALSSLRPQRFLNKRLLGGANLLLRRRKSHSTALVQQAIKQLNELKVDHVAISGDITNLALEEEFALASNVISTIEGAPQSVSIVPGNHDAYIKDATQKRLFEHTFAHYLKSDLPEYQLDSGYPFCHMLHDSVALIGLNSAIPTPYFISGGRVDERELRALLQILEDDRLKNRFVVVMVHHHLLPFPHSRSEIPRRMANAPELLNILRKKDVGLAIHGHNHYFQTHTLPHLHGMGDLVISEAGSTSVTHIHNPMKAGKFNVINIEDSVLRSIETFIWEAHEERFMPWRIRRF